MLAAEGPVPAHGSRRADALRKYYRLTDEDVRFFTVHQTADEDHTSIGKELLARIPQVTDQSDAVSV